MKRRTALQLLGAAAFAGLAAPAQPQTASPELRAAAERVLALLKGERQPADTFAPAVFQSVPAAQLQTVFEQLRAQYGAPERVARIDAVTTTSGTFHIETGRAVLHVDVSMEAQPPHLFTGLLVTGVDVRGDTGAAIAAEVAALPGATNFAVSRLGDGAPVLVAGHAPDTPLAIGSAFKLFILAELSRQIRAGRHRWDEVVALDRRSLPSGMLQTWPPGSPITVHSLAALMISISDNSAADTLLNLAGRENVERMMTTIGVQAAARNRPFLGTVEMFALKTASEADQLAWLTADEAGKRALLATRYGNVNSLTIDPARFGGPPMRIGELEWFASASDLVRTMDWLRLNGDATTLEILAINIGVAPSLRGDLAYLGYKGGSEPGVINLTWLARNRAGVWHALTGSWNNPAAAVEPGQFLTLMQRALQLVK